MNELLGLLKVYSAIPNLSQEPYKEDFFNIFTKAFNEGFCAYNVRVDYEKQKYVKSKKQKPKIYGSDIWQYAVDNNWVNSDISIDNKRYQNINLVITWWDEWIYAWIRSPLLGKKRKRKKVEDEMTSLHNNG